MKGDSSLLFKAYTPTPTLSRKAGYCKPSNTGAFLPLLNKNSQCEVLVIEDVHDADTNLGVALISFGFSEKCINVYSSYYTRFIRSHCVLLKSRQQIVS